MPKENNRIILELQGFEKDGGHVRFEDLVEELRALLTALNLIDKTVDQTKSPTLFYRVTNATHNGGLKITLEPTAREKLPKGIKADITARHHRFFKELGLLGERKPPSEDIDNETLIALKRLSDKQGKAFAKATLRNGSASVALDTNMSDYVKSLLEHEMVSVGSMTGRLLAINLHGKNNRFWIYPSVGPARIICIFPARLKNKAKEAIDKDVRVSGKKLFRPDARFPHRIEVTDFEIIDIEKTTSLMPMKGILSDRSDKTSAFELLEEMRDEW